MPVKAIDVNDVVRLNVNIVIPETDINDIFLYRSVLIIDLHLVHSLLPHIIQVLISYSSAT